MGVFRVRDLFAPATTIKGAEGGSANAAADAARRASRTALIAALDRKAPVLGVSRGVEGARRVSGSDRSARGSGTRR